MIRILIVALFTSCFGAVFSQSQADKDVRDEIFAIADSLRNKYQLDVGASVKNRTGFYILDKSTFIVTIKNPKNLEYSKSLFKAVNELSQNENYFDKVLSNEIYWDMMTFLRSSEDSIKAANGNYQEVTKLIQDIVYSSLKNCARYASDLVVSKVEPRHLNDKIFKEMKNILEHPKHTSQEAELYAKAYKPHYALSDTIGFARMQREFSKENRQHEMDIRRIKNMLRWAKEKNMTLKQWFEKENKEYYEARRADFLKMPVGLNQTVEFAAHYYVMELAPSLEKLLQIEKDVYKDKSYISELRIDIDLARLGYKNYREKILKEMEQMIKSPNNTKNDYRRFLDRAKYINTQESYFVVAPLLLVKDSIAYGIDNYTFGAFAFNKLREIILNFPEVQEILLKATDNGNMWVDEVKLFERLENENSFLQRMYNWMIENKGKYAIKEGDNYY